MRAICMRFHAIEVELRFAKSFSGPPEPGSGQDGPGPASPGQAASACGRIREQRDGPASLDPACFRLLRNCLLSPAGCACIPYNYSHEPSLPDQAQLAAGRGAALLSPRARGYRLQNGGCKRRGKIFRQQTARRCPGGDPGDRRPCATAWRYEPATPASHARDLRAHGRRSHGARKTSRRTAPVTGADATPAATRVSTGQQPRVFHVSIGIFRLLQLPAATILETRAQTAARTLDCRAITVSTDAGHRPRARHLITNNDYPASRIRKR